MVYYWLSAHRDKLPKKHERGPFMICGARLSRTSEDDTDVTLNVYRPVFNNNKGYEYNQVHVERKEVQVDNRFLRKFTAGRIEPSMTITLNDIRAKNLVFARVNGDIMRDVFMRGCRECGGGRTSVRYIFGRTSLTH